MITLDDLCAHLLPPDDRIKFQSLIIDEPHLILVAAMISTNSTCPDCRQPTHRIHGHYRRTLADLPWATAPIELRLIVRRFRCCTCTCRRKTFAERLPTVAPLYARTTTRLTTTQADTGLVLGGAAGARHLSRHGLPGSRNTLLRRVRSLCLPEGPEPEIIGIDDWAWRKGNRYGTIIVDLQRGCPIDLLEDRAAETVATWLQAHPDVKIVARDRAEAYASGVRQGAPEATQVADRFHLLKNLAAALQEVFNGHHREIDQLNHLAHNEPPTQDDDFSYGSHGIPCCHDESPAADHTQSRQTGGGICTGARVTPARVDDESHLHPYGTPPSDRQEISGGFDLSRTSAKAASSLDSRSLQSLSARALAGRVSQCPGAVSRDASAGVCREVQYRGGVCQPLSSASRTYHQTPQVGITRDNR